VRWRSWAGWCVRRGCWSQEVVVLLEVDGHHLQHRLRLCWRGSRCRAWRLVGRRRLTAACRAVPSVPSGSRTGVGGVTAPWPRGTPGRSRLRLSRRGRGEAHRLAAGGVPRGGMSRVRLPCWASCERSSLCCVLLPEPGHLTRPRWAHLELPCRRLPRFGDSGGRGRCGPASRGYPHGSLDGRHIGFGRRALRHVPRPLDCLARNCGN
jgi:hypothetical protein